MAEEVKELSESEKKKEDWMNSKWRPMMGWMYMSVCAFDFMIAPIMWSLLQALSKGSVQAQWQPLTLQGAGLFHVAMGAVLGIAAYGRTQEKLNGANNGGVQLPPSGGTTYTPPPAAPTAAPSAFNTPVSAPVSFSTPAATGFGGGFNNPTPTAPVITGFGGKKAPMPAEEPLL
jgi:hypothetical protein